LKVKQQKRLYVAKREHPEYNGAWSRQKEYLFHLMGFHLCVLAQYTINVTRVMMLIGTQKLDDRMKGTKKR
jgi:hypothetical protein